MPAPQRLIGLVWRKTMVRGLLLGRLGTILKVR
jgi:hypothetical protein